MNCMDTYLTFYSIMDDSSSNENLLKLFSEVQKQIKNDPKAKAMLRKMLDEDSTVSNESNNTPTQSLKSHDSKSKKRRSKISSSSKIFSNRASQQYYKGHAYSYESEIVDKLDEPYQIPKSKKVPFSKNSLT